MSLEADTRALSSLILKARAENCRLSQETKTTYVRDATLVRHYQEQFAFFQRLDPADCYSVLEKEKSISFVQSHNGRPKQSIIISLAGCPLDRDASCRVWFVEVLFNLAFLEMRAIVNDLGKTVNDWVAQDPRDFSHFSRSFNAFIAAARSVFGSNTIQYSPTPFSSDPDTAALSAIALALQVENDRLRERTRVVYVRDGKLSLRYKSEYDLFECLDPAHRYNFGEVTKVTGTREIFFEQREKWDVYHRTWPIQHISIDTFVDSRKCQVWLINQNLKSEPPHAELLALFSDLEYVAKQRVANDPRDFSKFLSAFLAFMAAARGLLDTK